MSSYREEEAQKRRERIEKNRQKRSRRHGNKKNQKKNHRRQIAAGICLVLIAAAGGGVYAVSMHHAQKNAEMISYEKANYSGSVFSADGLAATSLCVASENTDEIQYSGTTDVHAAGLFDLNGANVLYSNQIHDRLYPASTTKILTALLALEKGNLSDVVTVGENAAASSFPADASLCGLQEGDQLTLEDLLYGLLLSSGNDAATAIAEHISGSEEAFVEEMNARAKELMAVNTHFTNPHGLHDDNHYTTAYDLYLIFNTCIQNEEFMKVIEAESYTASIKEADGSVRTEEWKPTNYYARGIVNAPDGVTVVGGKTGTTGEAGYCLILLDRNSADHPYISIVMGAGSRDILYQNMNALLEGTQN